MTSALGSWGAGRRATVALGALLAALLVLGAALLGTRHAPVGHHGAADAVALKGGLLRVDAVTPDRPMRMAGMPMGSGPNMKDVPKGFRRFTVSVTLVAGDGDGLRVSPASFRVSARGVAPRRPIDDDTDVVVVPPRTSFPRELTFDVPQVARDVRLTVQGGEHPVPLTLAAAPRTRHRGH